MVPRRYEITITPDLDLGSFSGTERIEIVVAERVSEVVLNAADLEVANASIYHSGSRVPPARIEMDDEWERMTLVFDTPLDPGVWTLELDFAGSLVQKLRGFYKSVFRCDGEEHAVAATQFEATDARRAFPCWDEPDAKAVFSISLVVKEGHAAISNTPVAEEKPADDGRRVVRFEDTIPMSTYLVAFVVGPLEATDPVRVEGVDVRVVHAAGQGHLTSFAIEVCAHALEFFGDYFGIPYPGRKLDLIALPDFAFGAMENLGAVTFRESLLLIDPRSASRLELERVADVISHEIAHMWFGDLVTMKWWNGIWLNEAFATFMELACVDHFRPEWDRWTSFGLSREVAMSTDGLASTRPIELPVAHPREAEGMFDVLTYEKGASVLRMLEQYLGPGRFRDGIRVYLGAHLYANAETTDLWDALEQATGEPIRATMDSWIFQGGYPNVRVSALPPNDGVADQDDGVADHGKPPEGGDDDLSFRLALEQQPFRYGGAPASSTASWMVPVVVRAVTGDDAVTRRVLLGGRPGSDEGQDRDASKPVVVDLPASTEWAVVNAGGWGFYRVRYDPESRARLLSPSAMSGLGALERFNLLSDSWASVLAGESALEDVVAVLDAERAESDHNIWTLITGIIGFWEHVATGDGHQAVRDFAAWLLRPQLERIGWSASTGQEEGEGTPVLRGRLIAALGITAADEEVRRHAVALHRAALQGSQRGFPAGEGPQGGEKLDPGELDPNILAAVASVAAAAGGPDDLDAFLERYRHPRDPQEELRYLYAMASFRDRRAVDRVLDLAISEVRTQNAPFLIRDLLANRDAGEITWSFLKAHWDEVLSRFPDNTIPRMLEGTRSLCGSSALAQDVKTFLGEHPLQSGGRSLDQSLERLEVNLSFRQREAGRFREVLAPFLSVLASE